MKIVNALPNLDVGEVNLLKLNININSNNESSFNKDERRLTLNPSEIEENLFKDFIQASVKEDRLLLEDKSNNLLQEYKENRSSPEFVQTINFFRGKIPPQDLEILRAAFLLKVRLENNQPTYDIKHQISQRYGTRGNNISNLYSAGYYDSLIKPMHNSFIDDSGLGAEAFNIAYNNIVLDCPIAYFVASGKNTEKTKEEVMEKVVENRKYGIPVLHLHAVNASNISKIKGIVEEITVDNEKISSRVTLDNGHYIRLSLYFDELELHEED